MVGPTATPAALPAAPPNAELTICCAVLPARVPPVSAALLQPTTQTMLAIANAFGIDRIPASTRHITHAPPAARPAARPTPTVDSWPKPSSARHHVHRGFSAVRLHYPPLGCLPSALMLAN